MSNKLFITLIVLCGCISVAFAQPPAFTYQGKLTDAGNPANGNFDLQFKLFDAVSGGTQQGATLTNPTVAVSNGVFTVTLDFGANVFSGADRFLEIGVRPAGSVNPYTVLAPRQALTSSPYAIQTLNAQQLGGLPASSYLQNTNTPQAEANLNIGGSGTMGSLNVNGPVSLGGVAAPAVAPTGQGRLYFDSTTNKLKVSESGGAFVNLVGATGVSGSGTVNTIPLWSGGTALSDSLVTQSAAGNIGIGTTAPAAALHVNNGIFLLTPDSSREISLGTPNGEAGSAIKNAGNRADVRFDGTTLKLVVGTGVLPPATTNGLKISTNGNVGIGLSGLSAPIAKLEVETTDAFGYGLLVNNFSVGNGVVGISDNGIGIQGATRSGGFAGYFQGSVHVSGTLSKSAGSFKIDHPLDPENKYLYHSFVESPEMKNIYDGTVTTDAQGEALVTLPEWFEVLNKDFRYQLTVIGQFAQAIVAAKIKDNHFRIKTSLPRVEVSWQVTGVRQDAYANQHRIPVEEDKPEPERGFYLHPQVFNQPEEKGVEWQRQPAMMQRLKELREKTARTRQDNAAPTAAPSPERKQP